MSFPHQSMINLCLKKGNWTEQIFFVQALENFPDHRLVKAGAFVFQILSSGGPGDCLELLK